MGDFEFRTSRRLSSRSQIGDSLPMSNTTPSKVEILQVVEPRFERPQLALDWFNTEFLPGFSGATARDLVEAGRGQEVLDYIAAVDAGIHA